MKHLAVLAVAAMLAVPAAYAAPIFSEPFDYGDTTGELAVASGGVYTSSSVLILYDHDAGLDHPLVAGATPGALAEDAPDAWDRTATRDVPVYDYVNLSQGDTVFYMAVVQRNSLHAEGLRVEFSGDHVVTPIGFAVSDAGQLQIICWQTDPNQRVVSDTGLTLDADDTPRLIVLRATKGDPTGQYEPDDSRIDIWLDPTPADLLAPAGTGTPVLDSKWGRNGTTMDELVIDAGNGNTIDEIRVATDVADLNLIPEPTALMILTAILPALLKRRR